MKLTDKRIINALLNGKSIWSTNAFGFSGFYSVILNKNKNLVLLCEPDDTTYRIDLDIHLLQAEDWEVISE